jgi:hypothetical protein
MRKWTTTIMTTGLAAIAVAGCTSAKKTDGSPTSPAGAPTSSGPQTGGGSSTGGSGNGGGNGGGGALAGAAFVAQATTAVEQAQTVKVKESMSLLGIPLTANGVAKFDDQAVAADVTSSTPVGPVQVIIVDGDVYVKGLTKGAPGKPWAKNAGESKDIASALKQSDPRLALKMFADVGTLEPVGTETVNGVSATHYSVTVELAKLAKKFPDLADILDVLIKQGIKTQDVQLWVDDQKRPVRIVTSAQLPNPAKPGSKIASKQTVDFTDWGAPVSIQAPPADQVAN